MKFTVKHEFKHGYDTFEVDNKHDSDNFEGMSDEDVMVFYNAGWVDIEGKEPGPDPKPVGAELNVQNIKTAINSSEVK